MLNTKNDDADRNNDSDLSIQVNAALTKSEVLALLRGLVWLLETGPDDLGEWHEWVKGKWSEWLRRN